MWKSKHICREISSKLSSTFKERLYCLKRKHSNILKIDVYWRINATENINLLITWVYPIALIITWCNCFRWSMEQNINIIQSTWIIFQFTHFFFFIFHETTHQSHTLKTIPLLKKYWSFLHQDYSNNLPIFNFVLKMEWFLNRSIWTS